MNQNATRALALSLLMTLVAATGLVVSNGDAANAMDDLPAGASSAASSTNHDQIMDEEATASITLGDCTEHSGVFTFPASKAEPYLPDGFEPTGVNGDPLPDGKAVLIAMLLRCEGPSVNERSQQFLHLIVVDPPEAYFNEDAAIHYVNVVGVTTSSVLSATYEDWGIGPAPIGEIDSDGTPGAPGLDAWTTEASHGTDSATMTSTAVGDHPALFGGSVRIFGADDGAVTGIADFQGTAWEGALGESTYENGGLSPIEVENPGVAYHAWGIDYVVTPAGSSGST